MLMNSVRFLPGTTLGLSSLRAKWPLDVTLMAACRECEPWIARSLDTLKVAVALELTTLKPAVLLSNEMAGVEVNCRHTVIGMPAPQARYPSPLVSRWQTASQIVWPFDG